MTAWDLPGAARNELKTLSKENAENVARHLVMASRLIEEDPTAAHAHAQAAVQRAGRVGIVRETAAITAYAIGDFALALRELRTYRRISGRDDQLALMVDSERGVGRPDRALELGRSVERSTLPTEVRVELAIAMSGARLDQGEPERALQELDIPELDPDRAFEWSPGLFAARAAVLEELGRAEEAAQWQHRAEVAADALDAASGIADREFLEIEELDDGSPYVDPDAPVEEAAPKVSSAPIPADEVAPADDVTPVDAAAAEVADGGDEADSSDQDPTSDGGHELELGEEADIADATDPALVDAEVTVDVDPDVSADEPAADASEDSAR